jgi:hypothetical protein
MRYDQHTLDKIEEEEEIISPFEIIFENKNIIKKYNPKLCSWVIQHGQEGMFIEGFCGRYNICVDSMNKWLSDKNKKNEYIYFEFRSAVKISQSACLHYWNSRLQHAIKNFVLESSLIPVIRTIIADIIKTTPTPLRSMQGEGLEEPDTPEQKELKARIKNEKDDIALFGVQ